MFGNVVERLVFGLVWAADHRVLLVG